MKLKTFLLYIENAPQVELLSDEEAGQLFKALYRYVGEGEELHTNNRVLEMIFSTIKSQIDRGQERYQSICEKRKEAANKKWEYLRRANESNNMQMDANGCTCIQKDTNGGNNNPNPNPKPNPTDKKESEKEKAAHAAALLQVRKEDFYNSLIPYVERYGREMIRQFFDYWSEANKSKTRMRWEQQPTWETGKRLATWAAKDNQFNGKNGTNDIRGNSESRARDAAEIIARLAAKEQ